MAAVIETPECFPRDVYLGSLLLAKAGAPDHERCSGGETVPGVLGGWVCPCPCHRAERDSVPLRDTPRDGSKTVYFGSDARAVTIGDAGASSVSHATVGQASRSGSGGVTPGDES